MRALERAMRAQMGGGSVSTRLFEGDALAEVVVEGDRAWATRVHGVGSTDDVGFVRRKGAWYVRLFAKRPRGG